MANKAILFSSLSDIITKLSTKFVKVSDTTTLSTIDIDTTPTSGSTNLITSGGVYSFNSGIKTWYGTQAQYDAITEKDTNTEYNIIES